MAKLTREQAQKWNAQLHGDFRFDVRYYVMWGNKVARRNIELEDGKILQATLEYHDIRDGYRSTGKVQPVLHFQIWKDGHTEGMMVSTGMGASVEIGTPQNKRNWNELCKLSGLYDEAALLAMAKEHLNELRDPFVV